MSGVSRNTHKQKRSDTRSDAMCVALLEKVGDDFTGTTDGIIDEIACTSRSVARMMVYMDNWCLRSKRAQVASLSGCGIDTDP